MEQKTQARGRRQYVIAGLILLAGLVASAVILTQRAPGAEERPEGAETEHAVRHQVRFFDPEGELLTETDVSHGMAAFPPALTVPDGVHRSWDHELFSVTEELNVFPIVQPLTDVTNAVYADCVYAFSEEEIPVTICLGGEVSCCGFTVEADYDRELLKCRDIVPLLDGLELEHSKKTGQLLLTLPDGPELTEGTPLVRLVFRCRERDSYSTEIPILTREIHTRQTGSIVNTDSTAFSGRLFLIGKNERGE